MLTLGRGDWIPSKRRSRPRLLRRRSLIRKWNASIVTGYIKTCSVEIKAKS